VHKNLPHPNPQTKQPKGRPPSGGCAFPRHGDLAGCYKIKLRKHGYRLVYEVLDDVIVVLLLSVDKREDHAAYESAISRLTDSSRDRLIEGLRKKFAPKTKSKKT
jgi:hypothetical protein